MKPSFQQMEQARLSILRYCDSADRFGLSAALLTQFLRSEGLTGFNRARVELELRYLAEKGLVAPVLKIISPEIGAWRITAAGRDFLAARSADET